MNTQEYKGKAAGYLRMPLFMIIVYAAAAVFLFLYSEKAGFVSILIVIAYALTVISLYKLSVKRLAEEMMTLATDYNSMQKQFLEHLQMPYIVMDAEGRILWQNDLFTELMSESEKVYSKPVSSFFPEITREWLLKNENPDFSLRLEKDGRIYLGVFERAAMGKDQNLITLLLFDKTEDERLKQENFDMRLCCALLYIDNYEETMETVETVKQSLLTAVIDRKITRYFQEADAIIRKIEKDKYFIIFQNKYLKKLEDNKFSILDDMKQTKMGNDVELTVSIGIGLNGGSYQKNSEFARSAIDIALARGGSQAVVKDSGNLSYFGVRAKEIEKNTRVKARVKAEAIREIMTAKDQIIVMGHQISDVDAVGAGIGVFCAARELSKECHIVLNTVTTSLHPVVDMFTAENGYPADMFIKSEEAKERLTDNTLVVVVDTNRPSYTECPELLSNNRNVVVIDHHRQGDERLENPVLSYIEPYSSSACEMIAEILQYISDEIKLAPREADSIYAGILIDTNNFLAKTGVRTFEAAAYLKRKGADVVRVRKMLRENMDAYKARAEIVRNATVYRNAFAISVCPAGGLESPTIVGAQASNELLNIVGIKASFVLTDFDGKIYVSSRSIDEIDVQNIMERLGGGGHLNVAGAQIAGASVTEVIERIENVIDDMIGEGLIKL